MPQDKYSLLPQPPILDAIGNPIVPTEPVDPAERTVTNFNAGVARGAQPNTEGGLYEFSQQSGIPVPVLRDSTIPNFDRLRGEEELRGQLDRYPSLAEWMSQDLSKSVVASDDMDKLAQVQIAINNFRIRASGPGTKERIWATLASPAVGVVEGIGALGESIAGGVQFIQETGGRIGLWFLEDELREAGLDPAELAEKYDRENRWAADTGRISSELGQRFIWEATEGAGVRSYADAWNAYSDYKDARYNVVFGVAGLDDLTSGAVSLAPTVLVAPLGLPAIATAAGLQSFGGTYSRQRRQDATFGESAGMAFLSGAITAALTYGFARAGEWGGMDRWLATRFGPKVLQDVALESARKATRAQLGLMLGKQIVGEFLEEGMDELLQGLLVEKIGWEASLQQALKAGVIGGVLSGGTHGSDVIFWRRNGRAARAVARGEAREAIAEAGDATKTKDRSPEMFREFLQSQGLPNEGYVDRAVFQDIFEQNPECEPVVQSELEIDTSHMETVVPVDVGRVMTLSNTDLRGRLLENLRDEPDEMSMAEGREFMGNREAEAKRAVKDAKTLTIEQANFRAETERLVQNVMEATGYSRDLVLPQVTAVAMRTWMLWSNTVDYTKSAAEMLAEHSFARGTPDEQRVAVIERLQAERRRIAEGRAFRARAEARGQAVGDAQAAVDEIAERQATVADEIAAVRPDAEAEDPQAIMRIQTLEREAADLAAEYDKAVVARDEVLREPFTMPDEREIAHTEAEDISTEDLRVFDQISKSVIRYARQTTGLGLESEQVIQMLTVLTEFDQRLRAIVGEQRTTAAEIANLLRQEPAQRKVLADAVDSVNRKLGTEIAIFNKDGTVSNQGLRELQRVKDQLPAKSALRAAVASFTSGHGRVNAFEISKALAADDQLQAEILRLQDEVNSLFGNVPILNREGGIVTLGIEDRTARYANGDNNPYKPQFGGFARSFAQTFMDYLPNQVFEAFRSDLTRAVEHAYANREGGLINPVGIFNKSAKNVGDTPFTIAPPLREAEKTNAAINLNSACPMFMIGSHGCYFDGCYVTGQGKGGNTFNLYNRAAYTGEILQLSDADIRLLNSVGGLRVNGSGDLTTNQYEQFRDVVRHAKMRGLTLKVITKQDATVQMLARMAREDGVDISGIQVQPSIDPYWVPVSEDDIAGSLLSAFPGLVEALQNTPAGASLENLQDMVIETYESLGLEAKLINGKVYRKYGFSPEKFEQLVQDYPEINFQPRVVVGTPEEIIHFAREHPRFLQTWMHAAIPGGMYSDVAKAELPDGAIGNYTARIAVVQDAAGEWHIYAQAAKGSESVKKMTAQLGLLEVAGKGNSREARSLRKRINKAVSKRAKDVPVEARQVYTRVEEAIRAQPDADMIFRILAGQLDGNPSALCCAAGADQDACNNCTSHCHANSADWAPTPVEISAVPEVVVASAQKSAAIRGRALQQAGLEPEQVAERPPAPVRRPMMPSDQEALLRQQFNIAFPGVPIIAITADGTDVTVTAGPGASNAEWQASEGYVRVRDEFGLDVVVQPERQPFETIGEAELGRTFESRQVFFQTQALHGTGADILGNMDETERRFLLSHIGEGEGAQAFGWGLYFTSEEGVAKAYAEATRGAPRFLFTPEGALLALGGEPKLITDPEEFEEITGAHRDMIEGSQAVLVYPSGTWIEQMADGRYNLVLGNREFTSSDLQSLEQRLADWSVQELADFKVLSNIAEKLLERLRERSEARILSPANQILIENDIHDIREAIDEEFTSQLADMVNPVELRGMARAYRIDISDMVTASEARIFRVDLWRDRKEQLLEWNRPAFSEESKLFDLIEEQASDPSDPIDEETRENILDEIVGTLGLEAQYNKKITERVIYNNLSEIIGSDREASMFLLRAGIDGIRFPAQSGGRGTGARGWNYVVFDDTMIDIVEEQIFQAQGIEGAPPRASVIPFDDVFLATIFKDRDLSSVLHESSHIYLEQLRAIIRGGFANEKLLADWEIMADWLGITDIDAPITRDQHEQFARGTEQYFMEGKTPSEALSSSFMHYRRWLTNIYKTTPQYFDDVHLTDQVRMVFDRSLASEKEIQAKALENSWFVDDEALQDIPNLGPARRSRLRQTWEDARMRIAERLVRMRARKAAQQRAEWRAEIETDLRSSRTYLAWDAVVENGGIRWDWARTAEVIGGHPVSSDQTIESQLRAGVPVQGIDVTVNGMPIDFGDFAALMKKGLLSTESGAGIALEDVVTEDWESVQDLLTALVESKPIRAELDAWARAREAESDLEVASIEAVIEGPEFQELESALGRWLNSAMKTGTPIPLRKALRQRAEAQLAKLPIHEASRSDRFMQEAYRAHDLEIKAIAQDDFAAALQHNLEVRLQIEKSKLAQELKKANEKAEREAKNVVRVKPGTIEEAYLWNYAQVAVQWGLLREAPAVQRPNDAYGKPLNTATLSGLIAWERENEIMGLSSFAEYSDTFVTGLNSTRYKEILVERGDGKRAPYKYLTYDEFLEMMEILGRLEGVGRAMRRDAIMGTKRTLSEVREDMKAQMEPMPDVTPKQSINRRGGKFWARFIDYMKSDVIGPLIQVDQFLWRLVDNFNGGGRYKNVDPDRPHTRFIETNVSIADNQHGRRIRRIAERIKEPLEQIARSLAKLPRTIKTDIPLPEDLQVFRGVQEWESYQAFSIAFNMGTTYNINAVAEGYGWIREDADGNIVGDPRPLFELTKILTEADWRAVQQIGDIITEEIWPDTFETHKRIYGISPVKVDPDPVTVLTADGTRLQLRGWYWPVRFDPRLSQRQAAQDERQALQEIMGAMFAPVSARRGHTMKREGTGGKAVLLDFNQVLRDHINYGVRFITHAELMSQINKIFRDPEWSRLFKRKAGQHVYNQLNGWLRAQLLNEWEELTWLDRAAARVRSRTSFYYLGFMRLKGFVNQTDAIASLPGDLGLSSLRDAMVRMNTGPKILAEWNNMMTKSEMMHDRLKGGAEQIMAEILKGVDVTGVVHRMFGKGVQVGQWVGLWPIIIPSLGMEFPYWVAEYHRELNRTGDEDRAIAYADNAIGSTQPDTRIKARSRIQRSRKWGALALTILSSYRFRRTNANWHIYRAVRAGRMTGVDALVYMWNSWILGPMMPKLILFMTWAGFAALGDDDDEEELDRRLKEFGIETAEELLTCQVGGIPLTETGTRFMTRMFDEDRRQRGVDLQPRSWADQAWRVHSEAARGLMNLPDAIDSDDPKMVGAALWEIADLLGFWAGIPVTRTIDDVREGVRQYNEEYGTGIGHIVIPEPAKRERR